MVMHDKVVPPSVAMAAAAAAAAAADADAFPAGAAASSSSSSYLPSAAAAARAPTAQEEQKRLITAKVAQYKANRLATTARTGNAAASGGNKENNQTPSGAAKKGGGGAATKKEAAQVTAMKKREAEPPTDIYFMMDGEFPPAPGDTFARQRLIAADDPVEEGGTADDGDVRLFPGRLLSEVDHETLVAMQELSAIGPKKLATVTPPLLLNVHKTPMATKLVPLPGFTDNPIRDPSDWLEEATRRQLALQLKSLKVCRVLAFKFCAYLFLHYIFPAAATSGVHQLRRARRRGQGQEADFFEDVHEAQARRGRLLGGRCGRRRG